MRIFILLLFASNFYSCHTQEKEVNPININFDMTELQNYGARFGKARFLAVDDDLAIAQIGDVDIFLFDLKSGQVLKSIDTDIIIDSLEEQIHRLLGEQYFVPNKFENLKSQYAGGSPYDLHGLHYLRERGKFVVNMVATVFNRKDDDDQKLFPSLVLFDKNLDHIEIIPFDPLNQSTNSAWANGGFFLGQDRMFTKMLAWKHDNDFDFLEYRLTDDNMYSLADTLFGVKTDTLGYIGRFYECFAFNDKNYLNLGSMLYTFEGAKVKEGHLIPFPEKVERSYLYIEPYDENHLIAYATNNYRKEADQAIGWLLLLDNNFAVTKVISQFDLDKVVFCSLFIAEKSVYVANYDDKTKSYLLMRYEEF